MLIDDEQPLDSEQDHCNAITEDQPISAPHELFNLDHLEADTKTHLINVLDMNVDIMSTGQFDLGKTDIVTHQIEPESEKPKRQLPRRLPTQHRAEVKSHVEELLDHGVISPSTSPWPAPIVVVRKPDSSIRLCTDYRNLNSITKKDAFPMPRVDDAIDAMASTH